MYDLVLLFQKKLFLFLFWVWLIETSFLHKLGQKMVILEVLAISFRTTGTDTFLTRNITQDRKRFISQSKRMIF